MCLLADFLLVINSFYSVVFRVKHRFQMQCSWVGFTHGINSVGARFQVLCGDHITFMVLDVAITDSFVNCVAKLCTSKISHCMAIPVNTFKTMKSFLP